MGLFNKKASTGDLESILDQSLYRVPGTHVDISWADSVEGTLITGATGSGKSSAIGRHIGTDMLNNGFGMCVFCAKPDEMKRWVKYAETTNRSADLIILDKPSELKFNFLQYELERTGAGGGDVLNAINIIMNLNEQIKVYQGGGTNNKEERFWDESLKRLISRCISTLRLAGEEVSIYNIRKIVSNSFKEDDLKAYEEIKRNISTTKEIPESKRTDSKNDLKNRKAHNYFVFVIEKIRNHTLILSEASQFILDYWLKEFCNLPDKTKSIIIESLMGIIEYFLVDGILKDQFSHGLNNELMPENIIENKKILLINFPVKEFGLSGIFAATIYKTAFQAACERRNLEEENDPRPVGLFIDEFQSFVNATADSLFQATARSSWVACVYVTQNINNLFFVMGSNQPEARTKSLLGNLNLKYFANNADYVTNQWASEMIGKHWIDVPSFSANDNGEVSKSKAHQYHHKVTPDHFTTLKTGRKRNNFKVEAVVFKAGKEWGDDKKNYAIVEFRQR
ncbi:type IV secretory system conjugative DNA transfer family protein [Marinoscillum sp.]|uniref:type IV secretory system conjugative DNA transfer family protein n=1 Tax=Marinoscillum sp. TaxID=2024838 RepID=UPI003BABBE6F